MASVLDNLDPSRWRRAKSEALASLGEVRPFSHKLLPGHQIQILSTDIKEDLLHVRLRAVSGGGQEVIPPSHDFLFVNPPIMVKDGTRSSQMRRHLDGTDEAVTVDNYHEDLPTSLRELLAEAVRIALAHGHHSTTTTIFPDPGNPGTTSCDGAFAQFQAATWAAAHDAASASHLDFSNRGVAGATGTLGLGIDNLITGFTICRALLNFDTSSLTQRSTLLAATFSLVSLGKFDGGGSLSLVGNSIASDTAYGVGDYGSFGTGKQASDVTIASITSDDLTYNDWPLTSLSSIRLTGVTHLGVRHAQDVANVSTNAQDWVNARAADTAGTTQDPKLVITSFRDPAWSLTAPYYGGPHQPYRSFRSMILT